MHLILFLRMNTGNGFLAGSDAREATTALGRYSNEYNSGSSRCFGMLFLNGTIEHEEQRDS